MTVPPDKGKPGADGDEEFLDDLSLNLGDTEVRKPGEGGKKPAAKKPAAKKPAAKKAAAGKPAAKKPAAKKPTAKKPTAKKPATKKPTAKKPAAKKPTAKKPAAKKPTSTATGELGDETQEYVAALSAETREYELPPEGSDQTAEQPTRIAPFSAGPPASAAGGGRRGFPIWARFSLAAFLIIASVAAATTVTTLRYFSDIASALGHGGALKGLNNQLTRVDGGAPQTILLVGSDLRPEVKRQSDFRGLSDTTMLLRIDPDRGVLGLLSFPRDLKVSIPGYGTGKLNEAYAYGGPKLTLKTIQELTRSPRLPNGLVVNHLVNVDFEGFARAVNAIDCVFVDVDHRYYHSNAETVDDYEEINLQPGYQPLCGFNALDYARYRHTDNDLVRAARQQDLLREARQRIPPERLFEDRRELVEIFTKHTTSDIDNVDDMVQLLKLMVEARDVPLVQTEFNAAVGPSFVTATDGQIDEAVDRFLGLKDRPATIPAKPARTARAKGEAAAKGKSKSKGAGKGRGSKPNYGSLAGNSLTPTAYGRSLAPGLSARTPSGLLTIYYPTLLETGSDFAQKPRGYLMKHTNRESPPRNERAAYKWVFFRPGLNEYYGFQGTAWKHPPILENPTDRRKFGDREYLLFASRTGLRLVGWKTDEGSFWLSNTLRGALSAREMIEIARGMREYSPQPKRKK